MPHSTIFHLGHIIAEFRRSPAPVEHHHRHHAVVLTELIPDTLLDQEHEGRHRAERVLNAEVPYVRYLDRSDREDARLLPLRCDRFRFGSTRVRRQHSSLSLLCITMILRVRRNFFEITTFPNSGIQA